METLRPEVRPFIRRTFEWMASWKITEEDGGPYAAEQLALAKTDLLVRDMRRRRCEAVQ